MHNLLSLQVLRAAAAITVVIWHGCLALAYWGRVSIPGEFLMIGVDLFFVISGFIITVVAWDSFGRFDGVVPFVTRRLVRIGFLYWLLLTVYAATGNYGLEQLLRAYLLLPAYPQVIAVAWTLVFEIIFYGITAAALLLPRALAFPAIVAALFGVAAMPIMSFSQPPGQPIILEFAYGIAIAILYRRGLRITAGTGVALIASGLAAFALACWMRPESVHVHDPLTWGAPVALVVAGAVLGPEWRATRLTLFLGAIGDASYALYLTHFPIVRVIGNLARASGADFTTSPFAIAIYFAFVLAIPIGVALWVYRFVEKPVLAYSKRLTASPRPLSGLQQA
jgi:exopolysaccharide production protein ExoZ